MLNEIHELPDGFLDARTEDLADLLGKPTLIHLQGRDPRPLFVCTLLHGNETTGFYALQNIIKHYQGDLPRSLSLFIGNIEAARETQRMLEWQVDYNRIWPGTEDVNLSEAHMMQQVTDIMREKQPFASVDLHNNTGRNPHYGCINVLDETYLALAGLFSNTVVYFIQPRGVQSMAFAEFCPAVTLECGQSGEMSGIDHVTRYLQVLLEIDAIPSTAPEHINLYHTVARVKVPEHCSFGFADNATINLVPDLEMYNFCELEPGTLFAHLEPDIHACFVATNEQNEEVTSDYFSCADNSIRLTKSLMPSMLTMDTTVIRQDCLCYLMEKIELNKQ